MKTLALAFLLLLSASLVSARQPPVHAGHRHDVMAVKFSPDGRQLLSYSFNDERLILWDVHSGRIVWTVLTGFVQRADERYNLFTFDRSEDEERIITKSRNGTYQTWDAGTGQIVAVSEKSPDIPLYSGKGSKRSVPQGSPTDFRVTDTAAMASFSPSGHVHAVSPDGGLVAEGAVWNQTAIRITEVPTGRSWLLDGRLSRQPAHPPQPGELAVQLEREAEGRRAVLKEAKARRDRQAAIDTRKFRKQVYIRFAHYGDMKDPGLLRMSESDEPDKSRVKTSATAGNAVWVRLHNDSPLPVSIPTQSRYPHTRRHELPNGVTLPGLCDGGEISIWHGLTDRYGRGIPHGFDFGSSAMLLPGTSVLFAVPRSILRNGNAIQFLYTFQKETEERTVEDYGEAMPLRFSESDLLRQGG